MTFARSVRLAAMRVERQAPRQFAELVALIGGLLVGAPQVLAAFDDHQAAVLLSLMFVQWSAAALLWWIATRRRKFTVLQTASHITLGLALGDLIGFAIAFVAASIQTEWQFADSYLHAPWSTTLPGLLLPTLIRTPLRFGGWALLIALGRHGDRRRPPVALKAKAY
jgi:hypothetical protein